MSSGLEYEARIECTHKQGSEPDQRRCVVSASGEISSGHTRLPTLCARRLPFMGGDIRGHV